MRAWSPAKQLNTGFFLTWVRKLSLQACPLWFMSCFSVLVPEDTGVIWVGNEDQNLLMKLLPALCRRSHLVLLGQVVYNRHPVLPKSSQFFHNPSPGKTPCLSAALLNKGHLPPHLLPLSILKRSPNNSVEVLQSCYVFHCINLIPTRSKFCHPTQIVNLPCFFHMLHVLFYRYFRQAPLMISQKVLRGRKNIFWYFIQCFKNVSWHKQ